MSMEAVKQVIDRAVEDDRFRHELFSNPGAALEGYNLSPEEMTILSKLDEGSFDDFAGSLGDRTTKGWHPGS